MRVMALSDKRILEEMKRRNIVISPFHRANLATSSYDVSLGEWHFREQRPKYYHNIYNIYNKEHTDHVWGTKPFRAEKARDVFQKFKFDFTGIRPDDKIILLQPGEMILAHTEEFVGGRDHITTMMKARSSMGRNFIEVCKCAGWGDVGYTNRWTMEITNNSSHYAIPLVVGRRIAQMVFFDVGEILKDDYVKGGKYQTSQNLRELKKGWRPIMMLPKLYNDWEARSKRQEK
ncbi:hypothetical protein EPN83_03075 [Patescibacteria group bacterium]|nr:MAG: hypothetical protein EPN83_03075 [Patescibacteria group bacterium]